MTTSAEDLKQQLDELTEPQRQRIADFIAFSKFSNQRRRAFNPISSGDLPPHNVSHLASMIKNLTEEERQDLIKELHPNQYFKDKLNDFVLTPKNTIIDFNFNIAVCD